MLVITIVIQSFSGYPCNVTDIKHDYLPQDLALGLRKDSEIRYGKREKEGEKRE